MDPRHGEPGTQNTTTRHGKGRRWYARWVDGDGKERGKSFERKAAEKVAVVHRGRRTHRIVPRLRGENSRGGPISGDHCRFL
jgi:hypothetical protein